MDMAGLARVVKTADIGLGEAFMLREVETPDLLALMYVMCGNVQEANSSLSKMGVFNWAGMALAHIAHKLNANTVEVRRGTRVSPCAFLCGFWRPKDLQRSRVCVCGRHCSETTQIVVRRVVGGFAERRTCTCLGVTGHVDLVNL